MNPGFIILVIFGKFSIFYYIPKIHFSINLVITIIYHNDCNHDRDHNHNHNFDLNHTHLIHSIQVIFHDKIGPFFIKFRSYFKLIVMISHTSCIYIL